MTAFIVKSHLVERAAGFTASEPDNSFLTPEQCSSTATLIQSGYKNQISFQNVTEMKSKRGKRMNMKRFTPVLHIMIAAVMLASLGIIGLTAAPQAAQAQESEAPDSEVRPDVGPPGTVFRFFATGFQSGEDDDDEEKENVSVWINAPDGSTTTDGVRGVNEVTDTGRVDWEWVAPEDAQTGTWSAVAYGNESDHEMVILFEVREGTDAPPEDPERLDTNVQPQAGPGGTEFAFFATGFGSEEEFGIWVNTPASEVIDAEGDEVYKTTSSGRADWLWTAPVDAQPGMWTMVAHGKNSGVERVIPFEIVP
jgi:hypothetical protein